MTEQGAVGSIPVGWIPANLADIVLPVEAVRPGDAQRNDFLYIDISSIDNDSLRIVSPKRYAVEDAPSRARQLVRKDDIVFSTVRTYLRNIALVPPELDGQIASTGFCVLRPATGVSPRFLFSLVQTRSFLEELGRLQRGTSYPAVRDSDVMAQSVPLPPSKEQERIVSKLDELLTRLAAAVESLKAAQRRLKSYRQAVLRDAFTGNLTEEWRERQLRDPNSALVKEPAADLLRRIGQERAARSGSRNAKRATREEEVVMHPVELPDGWLQVRWCEVGLSQNGRAFPSSYYQEHGVKLLRPGNLHVSGRVEWSGSNTRCMPDDWAETYPNYIVGPAEIVMNLTAQSLRDEFLGRVCMTGPQERCLLNQRIARVTPLLMSPKYVFWLLKSPVFRRFVDGLNTGSLIQHMFTSQLDQFALPLPSLAEQVRVADEVERRLSVSDAVEAAIDSSLLRIESLRQSILKRAFEGKLVPQDPNDEPAEKLLERIAAARAEQGETRTRTSRAPRKPRARAPELALTPQESPHE